MTKNELLKLFLLHRSRVSLKMSKLGNDLAARGRRHDNSYSGSTELCIMEKISNTSDEDEKAHNKKLLYSIHASKNDYLPEFFENGILDMNVLQLIEFITDKVVEFEESVLKPGELSTVDVNECKKYVISKFDNVSDDVKSIIGNTVEYICDSNKAILKTLMRSEEGVDNVTHKEE